MPLLLVLVMPSMQLHHPPLGTNISTLSEQHFPDRHFVDPKTLRRWRLLPKTARVTLRRRMLPSVVGCTVPLAFPGHPVSRRKPSSSSTSPLLCTPSSLRNLSHLHRTFIPHPFIPLPASPQKLRIQARLYALFEEAHQAPPQNLVFHGLFGLKNVFRLTAS
jgi:hypothetical protein